jgi:branched-chain amino acid transport system permease protein
MNYFLHLATMICIYGALALTLNLAAGFGGMVSLCHAGFYGIGAYLSTLLMVEAGWSFWVALPCAVAATAALSLIVGVPTLRFRGDYFILGTLAFQLIIFTILYNWVTVTKGPFGIPGIPRPSLFGNKLDSPEELLVLAFTGLVLILLVLRMVQCSPFGRTLRAVRDDPIAAAALGKPVARVRIGAFALAAGLAAIPGAIFAAYARYIDPTSFTLMESIFILSIVIVGGAGSLFGPIIGAALLILLPEALRLVPGLPEGSTANLRQILYGLLLVVIMFVRPQGLTGEYDFD